MAVGHESVRYTTTRYSGCRTMKWIANQEITDIVAKQSRVSSLLEAVYHEPTWIKQFLYMRHGPGSMISFPLQLNHRPTLSHPGPIALLPNKTMEARIMSRIFEYRAPCIIFLCPVTGLLTCTQFMHPLDGIMGPPFLLTSLPESRES